MPGPSNNSSVSVFHFTSNISHAKIRKYKLATERGMAPQNTRKTRNQGATSTQSNGPSDLSERSADSHASPTTEPPPVKRPRLKLNVRQPKPKQDDSDTIAVSRPRREARKRYSALVDDEDVQMTEDTPEVASEKAVSPAPSSGLSSLSSAPPTPPREESPFQDPTPHELTARDDYGDFMSYYIAGGDEETEKTKQEIATAKGKRKSKSEAKTAKKVETAKTSKASKQPTPPSPKATPQSATPVQQPTQAKDQPPLQQPIAQQGPPINNQQPPAQQVPDGTGPRNSIPNAPPRYPQGPPPTGMQRMPPPMPPPMPPTMPMPPPMPAPVIHFIDIVHELKPSERDSIADMIFKLETLSSALTNFGGVPAVPATPPLEGKTANVKKAATKKQPAAPASNQIDGFLSLFDAADDDEDESEEGSEEDDDDEFEEEDVNTRQKFPGAKDAQLTYGIQFIQNALKSWAQQRTTHQITLQLQHQHNQALAEYYASQQNRGPGRPRKFAEPLPGQPGGPRPILQMDLAETPEGVAIKAFQRVLNSGALQVNARLHAGLSRALRHLYMQIDHLINQGPKESTNWQCMSYSAQISAHKFRVEQVKKADETRRQQMMGALPLNQQVNSFQAQQANAIDLERRRSMQHAQQQPYLAAQHLHPMQMNYSAPSTPAVPSPSPALGNVQGQSLEQPLENAPSGTPTASANGVQLDKIKLYMPGFLPRSGQAMKFSFAPHNEAAVKVFGSDAFPAEHHLGSNSPNTGPMMGTMSAPPMRQSGTQRASSDIAMPDAPPTTIDLTSDGPESAPAAPQVPTPGTKTASGFTAVNKPASAPPVDAAGSPKEASASPALDSGAAKSKGRNRAANMAARMPFAGAVIEDK